MKKQKLIGLAALTIILQGTAFAGLEQSCTDSLTCAPLVTKQDVVADMVSPSSKTQLLSDSFATAGVDCTVAVAPVKKVRSLEDFNNLPGAQQVHKVKMEEKQPSFGHHVKTFVSTSFNAFVTVVTSFVKKLGSFFFG